MSLEKEIQSSFIDEHQKLAVNIIYTQNQITSGISGVLKPFGISIQQFNVLRILRGQYPNAANVNLIIERMLDKMSNASRIVDKLEQKGLVERKRNKIDARNRDVLITKKGLDLLADIQPKMQVLTHQTINLCEEEARTLNALLDKLRQKNHDQ
ncbi:MAG: MarR family transcriptional regulator [Bacteroidetes bacterium]|nr:MarR family transcriptional regulator [Bacteroidota bacterium]